MGLNSKSSVKLQSSVSPVADLKGPSGTNDSGTCHKSTVDLVVREGR